MTCVYPALLIIVLNFIITDHTMDHSKLRDLRSADRSGTRCECGQLIAKLRAEGLELKCKRCKHFTVIPFKSIEGWTPAPPEPSPISR